VPITLARAGWGSDDNPEIDLSTHNGFLEFAYRGGIAPAILFVLLLGFCLVRAFRLSRDKRLLADQRSQSFALAAAGAGFILLNLTLPLMYTLQVAALFWICCGYLAAYTVPEYRPVLAK
jgi:O-antigen ligase